MKKKKIPAAVGAASRDKNRKEIPTLMSLTQFITRLRSCKAYYRGLVVRAIEDAVILLMLGVGIWVICSVAGCVLRLLGVG